MIRMKNIMKRLWIRSCLVILLTLYAQQSAFAQGEGFITPLIGSSGSSQEVLPPGAVHEGRQVLHVVSPKENLHLLAAYYYGDPRQWSRIYQDNRGSIRNPNRLKTGQTLRISVDETWTPVYSYQEWFRLATRNGEWVPGHWKRASRSSAGKPPQVVKETVPAQAEETVSPDTQVVLPVEAEEPEKKADTAVEEPPVTEEPPDAKTPPEGMEPPDAKDRRGAPSMGPPPETSEPGEQQTPPEEQGPAW